MSLTGKDKSEYVRKTFNSIAGNYDLMNTLMTLGMDKGWRRKVVKTVKAAPGLKILDVCCGSGKLAIEIAKAVTPIGSVTGLDFSEKMLEEAKKNIAYTKVDGIELVQGDAMNLPFANDTFDGATVGWGLRNLPDLRQGILEMVRVVKTGSMVVSLDMAKPEIPIFRNIYWFSFKNIIPLLGKIWADKQQEYDYLFRSASDFESQKELAKIFGESGLTNTGYINLFGGVVAVVYGQKP